MGQSSQDFVKDLDFECKTPLLSTKQRVSVPLSKAITKKRTISVRFFTLFQAGRELSRREALAWYMVLHTVLKSCFIRTETVVTYRR